MTDISVREFQTIWTVLKDRANILLYLALRLT
jgi:hypothetical protein